MRRTRAAPVPAPRIVERIRVPEVAVLTEAKRRIGRGDVGGALRHAYPEVVADLGRAYQRRFSPGWTHEEIVRQGFTEPMRPLLDFFEALWLLYAPFRYGGVPPPTDGERLVELLRSLYAAPPMWRLYLASAEPEDGHAALPVAKPTAERESLVPGAGEE